VRKLILTATGLLCLAGGALLLNTSAGQERKAPTDDTPHRVGLIDIGYVFSKYDKLKFELEELRAEAKEEDDKLKAKVKRGNELQAQMKELSEGSPDYMTLETKITALFSDVETQTKVMRRQFQQKEAKLYHQVYLEIQDVVERFCDQHKFTVVIRFNRTDPNSSDPQRVQMLMNQPVVYHRGIDDISGGVVKYLNSRYGKSAGSDSKPIGKSPKKDNKVKPAGADDR